MKNFIYCFFLCLSLIGFAQVQDITKLSSGKLESSRILTNDQKNVIGYVYVFNKGLVDNNQKKQYEYVILDQNLNKLVNGTIDMVYHKKIEALLGNVVFNQSKLYLNFSLFKAPYVFEEYGINYYEIDLKTNQILNQFFVRDYEVIDQPTADELLAMKPIKTSTQSRLITSTDDNHVLNHIFTPETNLMVSRSFNTYKLYDTNFNVLFEDQVPSVSISKIPMLRVLDLNKDYIVTYRTILKSKGLTKMQPVSDSISIYNHQTKQLEAQFAYNDTIAATYSFPLAEIFNEKIYTLSEVKPYEKLLSRTPEMVISKGIRRAIFDLKGNSLFDKSILYSEIFPELGFEDKKGKDGYYLELKEIFNHSDGSFSILFEKAKGNVLMNTYKSESYIIADFDAEANLLHHKLIAKRKVKMADSYLFSQINPDEKEILFFHQEKVLLNNRYEFFLVVNKWKNGEVKTEMFPFKTESSYLKFSRAKYGHILIAEFNKDDKESSIRLEKINL